MKHKYVCNITLGTQESILFIKCNRRSSSDHSDEGMATTCIRINLLPNVSKGSHLQTTLHEEQQHHKPHKDSLGSWMELVANACHPCKEEAEGRPTRCSRTTSVIERSREQHVL